MVLAGDNVQTVVLPDCGHFVAEEVPQEMLAALMDALFHQSFSVVGCDTGMDIAYALAADHRERVDLLAVAAAPSQAYPPHRRCSSPRRSTSTCFTSRSTGCPR